jgi:hypothetical protein
MHAHTCSNGSPAGKHQWKAYFGMACSAAVLSQLMSFECCKTLTSKPHFQSREEPSQGVRPDKYIGFSTSTGKFYRVHIGSINVVVTINILSAFHPHMDTAWWFTATLGRGLVEQQVPYCLGLWQSFQLLCYKPAWETAVLSVLYLQCWQAVQACICISFVPFAFFPFFLFSVDSSNIWPSAQWALSTLFPDWGCGSLGMGMLPTPS